MKIDENLIFRVQLLIKKIINLQLLLAGNLNVNMRCLQQRGIPQMCIRDRFQTDLLQIK